MLFYFLGPLLFLCSCEKVDNEVRKDSDSGAEEVVSMKEVARILSSVPLGNDRIAEVRDAVNASYSNGYDEEYTMRNIFSSPGAGVGEDMLSKSSADSGRKNYSRPLREVFMEHFAQRSKADASADGTTVDAAAALEYLQNSDLQLYWPQSQLWTDKDISDIVVTFDPDDGSDSNVGYYLDKSGQMQEILVTEDLSSQRPVWVVNRNDDALFQSLDVMLKNNPQWEEGGKIRIEPSYSASGKSRAEPQTQCKTLILKDFTMLRQYDSWFRGASEFFIKLGSVESFKAATEAELKLYNPSITDFMVVVRRSQVGIAHPLNTVLVSEWTSQLGSCALMITEDDGGTRTSWDCNAVVKYNSKSFGIELSLPYRSGDDIVWRGQLSRKYIEATNDVTGYFGDTKLTFSVVDN